MGSQKQNQYPQYGEPLNLNVNNDQNYNNQPDQNAGFSSGDDVDNVDEGFNDVPVPDY